MVRVLILMNGEDCKMFDERLICVKCFLCSSIYITSKG